MEVWGLGVLSLREFVAKQLGGQPDCARAPSFFKVSEPHKP